MTFHEEKWYYGCSMRTRERFQASALRMRRGCSVVEWTGMSSYGICEDRQMEALGLYLILLKRSEYPIWYRICLIHAS